MSIQGQLLDVTVVGCSRLKDTEWISRQDPYVCLEYANTKFRTRTCTDGGKNPTFQEKTVIPLIEGLREISVAVWNSNTITFDSFIGSGRIQLQKVLSQGYDDSSWTLQTKSGKFAGEVKLILHFAGTHQQQQQQHGHQQPKPPESNHPMSTPPPYMHMAPPTSSSYAPPPAYPSPMNAYSATNPAYSSTYLPAPYPSSTYPPPAYPPAAYPPTAYPSQPYPPAPANPYHAPGPHSGIYPPPPY
ncbi:elicitor-responsive protein 1 isoform X1 [Dendrobium catenatum]|uniref:elicitor-responsive protein 1 isoform X1 n=1 Tax=Dendrobium catenatum TaxID=906689 RepID=UPI0009F694EB|nr:elicitor-responsive protein 1 isoform X1 [Dendrobium catenatum]